MATSLHKFAVLTIVASLCLALLLPSVKGEGVFYGENCRVLSGKFKGYCDLYDPCKIHCVNNEGAIDGGCYDYARCWCIYKHCGTTCRKSSATWKGLCFRTDHCHQQCQENESALGGYCYWLNCQCLYNC